MRFATLPLLAACLLAASGAQAAGDFPLASCKGWNGTVTERSGVDTASARMTGVLTEADFREYCERDPDGETTRYGGTLTTAQCVAKHRREDGRSRMSAQADCRAGTLVSRYAARAPRRIRFPLAPDADTSCVSGVPPLIGQFKALCPKAAKRMRLE